MFAPNLNEKKKRKKLQKKGEKEKNWKFQMGLEINLAMFAKKTRES